MPFVNSRGIFCYGVFMFWKASREVLDVLNEVKNKHHKILEEARFAVVFDESKPFTKNRFNWGKTSKFKPLDKLFHNEQFDFMVRLSGDAWASVLSGKQREAWLDLHLTRCRPEMVPFTELVGKRKMPVKDEWGRTQFTDEVKRDDNGNVKWIIYPLDLYTFTDNVGRYGLWSQDMLDFRAVIEQRDLTDKA